MIREIGIGSTFEEGLHGRRVISKGCPAQRSSSLSINVVDNGSRDFKLYFKIFVHQPEYNFMDNSKLLMFKESGSSVIAFDSLPLALDDLSALSNYVSELGG